MTVSVPPDDGAVYKPDELMLPKPAFQVTAVFVLPLTEALNWTLAEVCTTAVPGVTLTLTVDGVVVEGLTVTVA